MQGTLFTVARTERCEAPPKTQLEQAEAIAEMLGRAWYSPAGRFVKAAVAFVVIGAGLALALFSIAVLVSR